MIRTALLSYGLSGKVFHAPFLELHPAFTLAGAWERSQAVFQEEYPKAKSYAHLADILSDPNIDLVVVNTPIYSHFDYAQQALLAGKHVIVEKAFTSTVAEAEKLIALAKEKQRHLFVFQNRRWDSDFLSIRSVAASGDLGEILEAEFHFDRFNPALSPKQHKESPNPGAGILRDLGPHIIDQALALFGKPNAIFADLRWMREGTQVEDYFELLLYYPKLRVRLKGGYFYKETVPAYQLYGSKGSFIKSRSDHQETDLLAGKRPNASDWGQDPEESFGLLHNENGKQIIPSPAGNYLHFFQQVADAILSGATPILGGEQGLEVMQIIEAAERSHHQQKVIELHER